MDFASLHEDERPREKLLRLGPESLSAAELLAVILRTGRQGEDVMALSHGAEDLYDGWMKDKRSAMLSCNDGFRPVSFLVEAIE